MKFVLRNTAGKRSAIEITEGEYRSLKLARNVLVNCLAMEEKYEILVSNYLELENSLLEITSASMVRRPSGYADFFDVHLVLNRRLVNLLTAARLYVDQLHRHVAACATQKGVDSKAQVKELFSKEYNENWAYRFMEALRNYVQHSGTPVHTISAGGLRRSLDMAQGLEYYTDFGAEKEHLRLDGKFKKSILEEINEEVDLKIAVRSYVESLSSVHDSARLAITTTVQEARGEVEATHRRYQEFFPGRTVGLEASKIENDEIIESIPLLLEWDDIRVKLQSTNQRLMNLSARYVTSKTSHS